MPPAYVAPVLLYNRSHLDEVVALLRCGLDRLRRGPGTHPSRARRLGVISLVALDEDEAALVGGVGETRLAGYGGGVLVRGGCPLPRAGHRRAQAVPTWSGPPRHLPAERGWLRRSGGRGTTESMTTDPGLPEADPADVAEQQADVEPPADDEELGVEPDEPPLEANEADVAEQRIEVPGIEDDLDED